MIFVTMTSIVYILWSLPQLSHTTICKISIQ